MIDSHYNQKKKKKKPKISKIKITYRKLVYSTNLPSKRDCE